MHSCYKCKRPVHNACAVPVLGAWPQTDEDRVCHECGVGDRTQRKRKRDGERLKARQEGEAQALSMSFAGEEEVDEHAANVKENYPIAANIEVGPAEKGSQVSKCWCESWLG